MELSAKGSRQDERWAELIRSAGGRAGGFERQWAAYEEIFADRPPEDGPPLAWRPPPELIARANATALARDLALASWDDIHAWSAADRSEFWRRVLERLGIAFARPPRRILDLAAGPLGPRWLPGARMNAVESCWGAPRRAPALVQGREGSDALMTVSYGELAARVERLAAGLAAGGFSPGDAVGLYMPLHFDCVAAYLALVRIGCRVVAIAESLAPPEVARRLEIGGACAVLVQAAFSRGGRRIDLLEKLRATSPPPAFVLPAAGEAGVAPRAGARPWRDLLGAGAPLRAGDADPHAVTTVLFSSGTTGTPKAIPWTHLTPIKCAMDGHFHHDLRPGDVVCWPTSIGWMMGPWLVWAALVNGATIALYEGAPTGADFCRFVERAGVTMLGVVPSLVRAWRAAGAADGTDWSAVRLFSSTGEASNVPDSLWLMSRAGYRAPVIEYCGGTEIGGGYITGTVLRPASPACFSTAALGLDLVVLDESGCEAGEGEVFLVPPSIGLSQELLNADHDAIYHDGCPRGPRDEPLRRHGDRMERLPGGFLRSRGRADDAMNLGGIKVSPVEIEQVLARHPAVGDCAAAAVPDLRDGRDRLVAWVVPRAGVDAAALERELAAAIRAELNPLFRLHDIVLVAALPRTASDKLMRRALREGYHREGRPAAAGA